MEPAESTSPARRKELQEKLARLNSRYVAGLGGSLVSAAPGTEAQEAGKVGLAALQDIAARQEAALAALEDVTPTNELSVLRYDPVSNKMSLTAASSASSSLPSSPQRLPASRCVHAQKEKKHYFIVLNELVIAHISLECSNQHRTFSFPLGPPHPVL